jgi:3-oxoacyl-[acyl-carrier-protein] synthase II
MGQSKKSTAVITGAGVVCPIGIGVDSFWQSLMDGRSGIGPFPLLRETPMPVRFGGYIGDFEPKQHVQPRKSLKVMSREVQLGFAAAALAVTDAELTRPVTNPDRFGVVFGSDMIYCELSELAEVYRNCLVDQEFDFGRWGEQAMSDMNPLWLLKYLPNMVACHIGIAHDARGHNNTITLGEASSLIALAEAVRVIERGHADVMITGGTGSRLSMTALMYRGDGDLSHRVDNPIAASRPFDSDRDGIVNGEGAGAFVLESRSHAEARGARILVEVAGCGVGHEPRSNGDCEAASGIRRAITLALADSQLERGALDHVNARGLSSVAEDAAEARVISDLLGDVPVTAPKSYFGSLGAGTGAVEMAASVIAFDRGEVPATMNYETPDPRCPINVISGRPKRIEREAAVVLNQAGTGQAAAVVLSRT